MATTESETATIIKNLKFFDSDIAKVKELKACGEVRNFAEAVQLATRAFLNKIYFKPIHTEYIQKQQDSPVFVLIEGKVHQQ